ncbi:MAG: RagB/SusD family nutrient uptake outer membrane protein [Phocaeicola sp.]
MKKILYISLLAFSLTGVMSSCDLDAPTQSALDASVIFSTPVLAEAAVMGIHQSFGETNSYRGRFLPFYGMNTDVEWRNNLDPTKVPDNSSADLCTYGATPTNTQMNTDNNAYAKFYEGIERANQAIVGIRTFGNVASNSEMAQLLGEALTLRAVLYLDLIKGWGDVPARFEPITSETMYLGRTDRDEIYKQLLNDLEEATNLVAWPNVTAVTRSTERVNKAFTKALRSRVALYAGGYSQRADGVRLSNDAELSADKMYAIVKKECVDVINSGTATLGSFYDNFSKLCKDDVTAGGESIWEIPFSAGRGRVLYTFGVKHQSVDQYTQQAQGGTNGPLPYLFYEYDVEDVRRDITCVPYEWGTAVAGKSKQQPRSLKSWCFGKLRYEWMNRIVTSTNDDGVNWQYMRLADVYLMAAEAINELDGPAAAATYMRPVLERALPAAKVINYLSAVTASKSAFFDAVVDQRALEFAGESLRKADLIRWNLLEVKLKEAQTKMKQLTRREGVYANLPERIYYQTKADGETLEIYGLNYGDTDEIGKSLGYESNKSWLTQENLTDELIDILYINSPNQNQFWPIWQTFIDNSNGMLSND